MCEEMVSAIQSETVRRMFSVRLKKDEEVKRERVAKGMVENVGGDGTAPKKQPVKVTKIGRNDPCPCGSGKKYKQCCGRKKEPQEKKRNRGENVVELEGFQAELNAYEGPLKELRDSL